MAREKIYRAYLSRCYTLIDSKAIITIRLMIFSVPPLRSFLNYEKFCNLTTPPLPNKKIKINHEIICSFATTKIVTEEHEIRRWGLLGS